jgi:hypothetical protein
MAISILFFNTNSIGEILSKQTQKNYSTSITEQIDALNNEPIPTLHYTSQVLTVGDANMLEQLFSLKYADGEIKNLADISEASLYLVDIKRDNNTSVLTKLSSAAIDALDTFPSMAIYDTEQNILYFQDSGIYTFYIRLYFRHHSGILYECQIPVETR